MEESEAGVCAGGDAAGTAAATTRVRPLSRDSAHSRPVADSRELSDGITVTQRMLSACSGSLLTSLLVTPLDVVKVRMQAGASSSSPAWGAMHLPEACRPCEEAGACVKGGRAAPHINVLRQCTHYELFNGLMEQVRPKELGEAVFRPPPPAASASTLGTALRIVQQEGVPSLWRGIQPTLAMSVPATVLYFTAYEEAKIALERTSYFAAHGDAAPLVAGAGARTLAATAVAPLELLRTRMQARRGGGGALSVVRQSMRDVPTQGVLSLFRGLGASILRDVPFSALYWMGYERALRLLSPDGREARTPANTFAAGVMSGSVAATVTTPFDVLKTRMQVFVYSGSAAAQPPPSYLSLLRGIVAREGYGALATGTVARVARVAPSCGIMIASYEAGKRYFARQPQ